MAHLIISAAIQNKTIEKMAYLILSGGIQNKTIVRNDTFNCFSRNTK
jgi:hypothetical protein